MARRKQSGSYREDLGVFQKRYSRDFSTCTLCLITYPRLGEMHFELNNSIWVLLRWPVSDVRYRFSRKKERGKLFFRYEECYMNFSVALKKDWL